MRQMIEGNRNYGGGDRDDRMLRDVAREDNGQREMIKMRQRKGTAMLRDVNIEDGGDG